MCSKLFPKLKAVVLKEAVVTGEATVNAVAALCEIVPQDSVRVLLAVPGAAFEDADMLICAWLPGRRDRLDGVAATRVGSGPTVTATLPLKPFTAEAITVIACAVPPGITLMVDGAAMREKSAWLWGSAWLLLPPPPQPRSTEKTNRLATKRSCGFTSPGPSTNWVGLNGR